MVWQFQWMIMVIFTVADIRIGSLDFKVKNVSDADKSYILKKITSHFRQSIFHWLGIRQNYMSVMRHRIKRLDSIDYRKNLMKKNVIKKDVYHATGSELHITAR